MKRVPEDLSVKRKEESVVLLPSPKPISGLVRSLLLVMRREVSTEQETKNRKWSHWPKMDNNEYLSKIYNLILIILYVIQKLLRDLILPGESPQIAENFNHLHNHTYLLFYYKKLLKTQRVKKHVCLY